MLVAECDNYWSVKKSDHCWTALLGSICRVIIAPLYIIWRILLLTYMAIRDYCVMVKEHGGYKGYQEWKRSEALKEKERARKQEAERAEYDRIVAAFKNGEIRRDELPRDLNGITDFELYGNFFSDDLHELVYVENDYNEALNDFFRRHDKIELQHGMRVVYLPRCLQELQNEEVLKYWNPSTIGGEIDVKGIDTSALLNDVCYPEDTKQIRHGLMSCLGWGCNHGVRYLYGSYYQIEEGSDEEILSQIECIASAVYVKYTASVRYMEAKRPAKDKIAYNDLADIQFDEEINTLIDEIRGRVEALEQRGLSRNLLMKLLVDKRELSRLVVTTDLRVILTDYGNMEIKMEPINKAVFLLFLRHPEGIVFKYLPDYRNELAEIYQKIKPLGLNDRVLKSIEDVTNPCLNSINEKCARIRGAFVAQFDDSLAHYYYINGNRGEAKKIALPRDLVSWE